jgi:hypothetical protein
VASLKNRPHTKPTAQGKAATVLECGGSTPLWRSLSFSTRGKTQQPTDTSHG